MLKKLSGVKQTTFEEGLNNAFSACVATILGKKLSDVPDFAKMADKGDGGFWELVSEWLASIGYTYRSCFRPPFVGIALGKSPRSEHRHAVVWKNGRVQFDPHPENKGLLGRPESWIVLIPQSYPHGI